MPDKRTFKTDRELKTLKPADRHYDVRDLVTRNLAVRVGPLNNRGEFRRTFVFVSRFPGSSNPVRHSFGEYKSEGRGDLTLEEARLRADEWRRLIRDGIDPRDAERSQRQEAQKAKVEADRAEELTFGAVAEAYILAVAVGRDPEHPKQRKGNEVARDIRRTLLPIWGDRPIADITRRDIRGVIEGIRDLGTKAMLAGRGIELEVSKFARSHPGPAPIQARHLLGYIKRIFGWALETEDYGLDANPAASLRASFVVGDAPSRDRILSDDELGALWKVAGELEYPYGAAYRLLILTGLRLNEVARATWREVDLAGRQWVIPRERMKAKNSRAKEHVVPLSDEAATVFGSVPQFAHGDFIFTTSHGRSPAHLSAKIKARIDAMMHEELRSEAERRGEDAARVDLSHWTNHDIRRTMRSGLSRLRVPDEHAEAVLAHVRPGVRGTYDRYQYFDEKAEALARWGRHVVHLADGAASTNVVELHA